MELTEIRDLVIRKTGKNDIDDVDDAISLVHKTYIQPAARIIKSFTYTTGQAEEIDLTDLAQDIYKIVQVDCNGVPLSLLNLNETDKFGVRRDGDKIYFQGVGSGKKLTFRYQAKLKELNKDNPVPEIDEDWHDLYWLGAVAILDLNWYALFQERLAKFKYEMFRKNRPRGGRVRVKPWC